MSSTPPTPHPSLFITQATPPKVLSGFIVQLIMHLSLAPSVWIRVGPKQVFMANLIYGAEDTAVWPQTGVQTEVTGVQVREMTHMCPYTYTQT